MQHVHVNNNNYNNSDILLSTYDILLSASCTPSF